MPKKNKWTLVPFILAATLILILLYFITARNTSRPAEPLKAIPRSASVIVKVNDPESLFEKTSNGNPLWNELGNLPLFARINSQMKFIDSLSKQVAAVRQVITNPPLFISAHVTGKDRISIMHVLSLPPRIHERDIKEIISNLVLNSGTMTTRKYEGVGINEVALLNKAAVNNFSFAVYRDILIISFSTTVLEDAIRQLTGSGSFADEPGFERIYATAGKNVDANVFINFREFPKSLSTFVNADYKSEVRSLRNFAGWAELDLNPLTEMLFMNGFVNGSDSVTNMASLLLEQSPHKISADEVLPSSVATCLALSLSDPSAFLEGYRELLRNDGRLTSYNNTLQSINNAYSTHFPDEFTEIMDREIALGIDGNSGESGDPRIYVVLRIKSKTQAESKFRSVVESIAAAESRNSAEFMTQYRFDADLTFTIYELPVRRLTGKIFGPVFSVLDRHYFVVLDNYLVFSNSVESVKILIRDYVLNKTLANDLAYKEFKSNLSPRSNFFLYCDLGKSQPFFSPYLVPSVDRSWQKNIGVFQKIRVAGLQLYTNNKMLYSNFLIKHLSSFSASAQTVWESRLDTVADFKPVFVQNHQTGENEVFVQDLNNTIYLINQVGRILWKIKLPAPIRSDVFQIDYFRNGKLQLLFSTQHAIYVIDRNGNFVERYPITLRSPATNGVSVFDYDRNRDYRLFIACEDRHVYAYNREGNLLEGWEFGQSESEVTQPVNHYRIGDRDFIVFGDRYRTYILDRKGTARVNVEAYFERSAGNNYTLNLSSDVNSPSVVTTDTSGKVYFIGFTGSVKTSELPGKFTNSHYFDYRDLNGDNKPEFIYLQDDRLLVYANDGSRLFTFRFGEAVHSRPVVYQFTSTDRKIGIVSRNENLIYLINGDGKPYEGFPLQGNTPFSIGNFGDSLSRFNLIVGSADNFLYNYRVN